MSNHNHDGDDDDHHHHNNNDGHIHRHGQSCKHDHVDDIKEDEKDPGTSLYAYIDKGSMLCFNELEDDMCKNIIKSWDNRNDKIKVLKSEKNDPELILYIPFTQRVYVKTVVFGCDDIDMAPTSCKIYKNRDDVNFQNVGDLKVTQEFKSLVQDSESKIQYFLTPSKFGSVGSLTFYFKAPQASQIKLHYIGFYGKNTNIKHGQVVHCVYESTANKKDHDLSHMNKKQHDIM